MRGAERGSLLAAMEHVPPDDGARPQLGRAASVGSARSLASLSSVDAERLEPTIQADVEEMFASFDEDRGGTIDLEEFSNFLNRVLHLNFDDETMRGIMAKFGSGA